MHGATIVTGRCRRYQEERQDAVSLVPEDGLDGLALLLDCPHDVADGVARGMALQLDSAPRSGNDTTRTSLCPG